MWNPSWTSSGCVTGSPKINVIGHWFIGNVNPNWFSCSVPTCVNISEKVSNSFCPLLGVSNMEKRIKLFMNLFVLQKMSSKVSGWVADFIPKIIAA